MRGFTSEGEGAGGNWYGRDAVEAMPPEERGRLERELMDKLYAEFHQNGLNNLILYRPS